MTGEAIAEFITNYGKLDALLFFAPESLQANKDKACCLM